MKSHLAMFYGLKKTFHGLNVISEEHDTSVVDLVIFLFFSVVFTLLFFVMVFYAKIVAGFVALTEPPPC